VASRGRPVVIAFSAKVRDYLRGTKKVEQSTEDIGDSLQDAAKDSDKFERQFKDAMKDAERQADRSARKIEDDFDKTPGQLGEIGQDAGQEFTSNIGEAVSSGDIGGLIEGTLGGIVGGLKGPMGLAAAGLAGVAVLAFQRVQQEAEKVTAFVESWSEGLKEMIRATADELDTAVVEEAYRDWIADNEELFHQMVPLIEEAGLNAEAFARMLFSGDEGAQEVLSTLRGIRDVDAERITQGDRTRVVYGEQGQAANDLLTEVEALVDEQQDAYEAAENYSKLVGEDAVGAVEGVRDAWADTIDALRREKPVVIRAEIQTTVSGPGRAYVNTNSSPTSPSNVAGNGSRYRNSSGNRSR
jgi:hypothetical protein